MISEFCHLEPFNYSILLLKKSDNVFIPSQIKLKNLKKNRKKLHKLISFPKKFEKFDLFFQTRTLISVSFFQKM
ncbi:hypothetical protein TRFO_28457 [Tritrichomonas foetus]|uniref:Uncharacterized protein n=1 Tax=Tritrichomonas foetus TaxID=1144522 RepID=A0A1J4JZI1_9EUKA|nr:hypothetical protein TRFO_28457 [Tritrichomonas foetus]|eukprot:OHT04090.1 hypothetical protein TRFO_28457 [Tritrichomonas foetus]